MLIRSRFSLFMLMVVLPVTIALINIESFFVLTSILILFISGKSLRQLFILNFGSDSAFEALEQQHQQRQMLDEKSRKLNRMMVFLLNLLFIIFFVYIFFISDNIVLRSAAIIAAASWVFDMLRTFAPKKQMIDSNEGWTFKDTLAEVFLWFHNLSTIAVVAVVFAVNFL